MTPTPPLTAWRERLRTPAPWPHGPAWWVLSPSALLSGAWAATLGQLSRLLLCGAGMDLAGVRVAGLRRPARGQSLVELCAWLWAVLSLAWLGGVRMCTTVMAPSCLPAAWFWPCWSSATSRFSLSASGLVAAYHHPAGQSACRWKYWWSVAPAAYTALDPHRNLFVWVRETASRLARSLVVKYYIEQWLELQRGSLAPTQSVPGLPPAARRPGGLQLQSTISINSLGFRGRDIRLKKGDAYRIVALGESTTLGARLEFGGTARGRRVLRAHDPGAPQPSRPVQVINAGIPGYRLNQNVGPLRRDILRLEPDMIISYHRDQRIRHAAGGRPFAPVTTLQLQGSAVAPAARHQVPRQADLLPAPRRRNRLAGPHDAIPWLRPMPRATGT